MEARDWITIVAVLAAPLLAIQAQRAIDAIRESISRKREIFFTLMSTRAIVDRTCPAHVYALNSIQFGYYGRKIWRWTIRSRAEERVLRAWREYLDFLNRPPTASDDSARVTAFLTKGDDLFHDLLYQMSQEAGFRFDRVDIRHSLYYPKAFEDNRTDHNSRRCDEATILQHLASSLRETGCIPVVGSAGIDSKTGNDGSAKREKRGERTQRSIAPKPK